MAQQASVSVENNFTKGLITESTGLNFPENAATDTDNCLFTLIGDTSRRLGINYEDAYHLNSIDRTNLAVNTYKWNNAGGDGLSQVLVQQTGSILYFYKSSDATVVSPLSNQRLISTVDMSSFVASGGMFDTTVECQFSDGNGYLFVYHPGCDPVYCTYDTGTVTGNAITVQIRDLVGIPEGTPDNYRPLTLSSEHSYNLHNQGWIDAAPWSAESNTSNTFAAGSHTWTIASGLTIIPGTPVVLTAYINGYFQGTISGIVVSYAATSLTVNITNPGGGPFSYSTWTIIPTANGYIDTWFADVGNYPSNADVWWYYKDSTGTFNPTATYANISVGSGPAPRGHFILDAFNQLRSNVSAITGLTDIITTVRPRTGTWFQGRVWYAGVDSQQALSGNAPYYTWTENIYFSQIVQKTTNFGQCYQLNDGTSENLFDLLPTDGGVIVIQGCGPVYKLFPIQNGMLVFAANGIWFITGSQGIGFSANDYTITKISAIQSIASTSFVDVNGLPYFWNEEGIYTVTPAKTGGLEVMPLTVGTILSFYNEIPKSSKNYVRGAYNPIDYVIQWIYKDTEATSVTDRYTFDRILNFNIYNKAFYPYSVEAVTNKPSINGINYVVGPGGLTSPDPMFKYLTSVASGASYDFTFSEENDERYRDFYSYDSTGIDYESFFVTGFKLKGQAIRKFQPTYVQVYSRSNGAASAYKIQGIWDYANNRSSGRWSSEQLVTNALTRFDTIFRRHKIRGHGYALQFKISSVSGQPFDIQGWANADTINAGM